MSVTKELEPTAALNSSGFSKLRWFYIVGQQ